MSRVAWFYCQVVLTLCFGLFCQSVEAWSGKVHAQIGHKAFDLLNDDEQAYYRRVAQSLPKRGVAFGNLSAWVDSVRGEPLFELFDQDVPEALFEYRQRHTSTWHYENAFYHGNLKFHGVAKKHACRIQNKGKLEPALVAIDQALESSLTAKQEAILVAFAMHLIEDVHQPLHTTTMVREDCSHDRGGNLYCLTILSGRCAMNLHRLWDQAFGVADDSKFMAAIQIGEVPALPFTTGLALKLHQGHELARKAYNTEENKMPQSSYFAWARGAAELQVTRSVQSVAHYLKRHYERKFKK